MPSKKPTLDNEWHLRLFILLDHPKIQFYGKRDTVFFSSLSLLMLHSGGDGTHLYGNDFVSHHSKWIQMKWNETGTVIAMFRLIVGSSLILGDFVAHWKRRKITAKFLSGYMVFFSFGAGINAKPTEIFLICRLQLAILLSINLSLFFFEFFFFYLQRVKYSLFFFARYSDGLCLFFHLNCLSSALHFNLLESIARVNLYTIVLTNQTHYSLYCNQFLWSL